MSLWPQASLAKCHLTIAIPPASYIKIQGRWMYLYRAIDSAGDRVHMTRSPPP